MTTARRACLPLLLLPPLLLLAGSPCLAQGTSASLVGSVQGEEGEAVGDAVVQARSEETGVLRSAPTDERGAYRIDLLRPGRWTVVARLADGRSSESRSVELSVQRTLRLDFTVGAGLEERLRIVAEAPLVDRRRTGGELRILGAQTDTLPIHGRRVTELALLDASVQAAPTGNFFGEQGSVFVVNGQTGRSNSFLVDGLDNNDQTSGTSLSAYFSQQVIREFVMHTHQYLPEFGRASGGVLNIVTHQGSNDPSWEAFVQGTRSDWNTSSDLLATLPPRPGFRDTPRRLQAGFRMGGPLKRDRAFYFLAYEHQDSDEIVPWTGLNREGTLGGWVRGPARSNNLFLRTDFNLSNAQVLMVRLSADDRTTRQVNVGGRYTTEFGFRLDERDVQLAASLTSIVSPDLFNELRVLVSTSTFDQFANSIRPGVDRPSGLFGGNNLARQERGEDRIQLVENVTWKRRRHTLKFGLDVTHTRTDILARFNPAGNFLYTTDAPLEPGDCGDLRPTLIDPADPRAPIDCPGIEGVDDDGDGVIDEPGLIGTYPLVYQYVFGEPKARLDDTRIGLFVQDQWQAGSKLLLDYGLRYDVSTYRLPESASVDSPIPNGGADRDRDNLAPRFGFTFTPRSAGKLVFRGGAGVFYDKLVLGFPAVAAVTSGTKIGLFFPQGLADEEATEVDAEKEFERLGAEAFREQLETLLVSPISLILRFSTATELETPYTVQFTAGVERAAGRNGSVSVNVIRALGYHLPLMRDLNPVLEKDCGFPLGIRPLDDPCLGIPEHRDGNTGSIAALTTEGRSWYTGVDLGWRWRGDNSWFSASYGWSRSEDLGPDPLKGGIYLPPNSDDIHGERGPSDADRRHRLVLAGETALWRGLRVSGVIQLASSPSFNVTTGLDDNLDGINTDRPEGVGRNSGEDTPLGLVNAIRAQEGLAPVGALRARSFAQVDLRVSKPFPTGRRGPRGSLFIQVFNLLDRYNAGPPEGRVTSRNFGRPVGLAGPPRTVEVGVRFGY